MPTSRLPEPEFRPKVRLSVGLSEWLLVAVVLWATVNVVLRLPQTTSLLVILLVIIALVVRAFLVSGPRTTERLLDRVRDSEPDAVFCSAVTTPSTYEAFLPLATTERVGMIIKRTRISESRVRRYGGSRVVLAVDPEGFRIWRAGAPTPLISESWDPADRVVPSASWYRLGRRPSFTIRMSDGTDIDLVPVSGTGSDRVVPSTGYRDQVIDLVSSVRGAGTELR